MLGKKDHPMSFAVRSILEEDIKNEEPSQQKNAEMYERSRFANRVKLDKKLEHLGISWKSAQFVVWGFSDADDFVDKTVCAAARKFAKNFIMEGRIRVQMDTIWMDADHVMKAVATPGYIRNGKVSI